jgi:DNA-binding NarL/FixJ family response regulator
MSAIRTEHPGDKLRIVIADDHEIVRKGLISILQDHPGWQIVAEAGDGREAVSLGEKHQPDIVIMDLHMPGVNGLDATRQLLALSPETWVLVLTLEDSDQLVREVLAAGARGFVLKSDAARHLVTAVEALAEGRTYFSSKVADLVLAGYLKPAADGEPPQPEASSRLSPREREVVQLLAEGKSNKEVAEVLHLSVKTVETHRAKIMAKLELRSFSDLVRYAIRNRIVQA